MRAFIIATALTLPLTPLYAAGGGGGDTSPPKQTQTTKDCLSAKQWDPDQGKFVRFSRPVNGVWDAKLGKCVRPDRSGHLGDDVLYRAVREMAYAGHYESARQVLDQMRDQSADEVLTYRGFIARKEGKLALADLFYRDAIAANPDNILARSYMGQGLVEAGDRVAALTQLREIEARGGADTWAARSLREAIESGITYSY